MKISPIPKNEKERLVALKSYHILDTDEEKDFDDITILAAQLCNTPISVMTLVDEKRQWFKAKTGWVFKETDRDLSFCAHAIHYDNIMMVPDTLQDERFFDNPLVTEEPAIRFYAGVPLVTSDGYKIGTLAVIDRKPGTLNEEQISGLRTLGRQVVKLLNLRLNLLQLESRIKEKTAETTNILERITDAFVALDKNWCYTYMNKKAGEIFQCDPQQMMGKHIWTEFPEGVGQPFHKVYEKAMATQQYVYLEEYYAPYDLWFENHIYPSPEGLSIFFRDFTERKKAEEKIKENERNLRLMLDKMIEGVIIVDFDLKYIYLNDHAQKVSQYPKEELIGNKMTDKYPGVEKTAIFKALTKCLNEREPQHLETEFIFPDGSSNWFLVSLQPVEEGAFILYFDINELKKSEENLREAYQRLTQHLNNTPLAVIEWDKNFIIQKWSPQAESIFGWSEAEVINKHFNEFNLVFEEDAGATGIIAEELLTGAVDQNKIINRNNTKSGKVIYCQWFNSVLKDEKGNTQSILSLIQDVTGQKKGEEEIKKAHDRFEMIASTTNDAIWEWNLITGELWANEVHQQLYGRTKADPIPTEEEWKERIHPQDRNKTVSPKTRALTSVQNYWESEYRFQKPDGHYIVLFDRSYIIRNADGKAVHITGSMFDITERIKAEETVKNSEEKRRLIMNAALDAIICIDTKGKITFWNPQAEEIFGWKAEEVMGCILSEMIIPHQYRKMHDKGIEHYLKTGYGPQLNELLELSAIDRSGREFPIELTVLPVKQGDEEFFCAFIRDITGRKKEEAALKESEELMQSVFDTTVIGFSLLEAIRNEKGEITDFRYKYASRATAMMNNRNDLQGKIYSEVHSDFKKVGLFDNLKTVVESGQPGEMELFYAAEGFQNWFQTSAIKLGDGVVLSFADITVRKTAQLKIYTEKKLSDSIINSLPGIFYLYNQEGKFLRWNKNFETVTGYSSVEITSMHPLDFFEEGEKQLLREKINNVFVTGEDSVVAGFLTKEGKKIPYYFTGRTLNYEDQTCLMGVGIDIAERVKAQEELKQQTELLRQLNIHLQTIREEERKRIGREIHDELGQQLTAIKMDVSWIDKKTTNKESLIKNKLKNIKTLLDGSNQSVRKILNELRPAGLENQALTEAIEWQSHQFTESTGIKVQFAASGKITKLPEQVATCMFRVYQESLTNIMRHAQASKVLTSLKFSDDSIILTIKDDGNGFDIKSVKSKKSFGILGMKERVRSLNGKFELVSSKGKGTKIVVSLPYKT